MSRYVVKFSFYGTVVTTRSRTRTSGTPTNLIQPVVSIVSLSFFCFPLRYRLTSTFLIDSPELGPGAVLGPSGVSTPPGTSPTVPPTPSPPGNNTGAIVGGVIGGVAAISIAAAVIFFYLRRRRHSRAPSVAAPGVGASQSPVDEIKPLTEEGTYTGSSLPGTSSMPGTPGAPMRLYVRVFVHNSPPRSYVRSLHVLSYPFFLLLCRTRMIQLRSLGTKGFCSHQLPPKDPCHHITRSETPWLPRKPRGPRDTMVCLLSDFALMNHRSYRSGVRDA